MHQLYKRGDLVRLSSKFPKYANHFPGEGGLAIIKFSYLDKFRSGSENEYEILMLEDGSHLCPRTISWYDLNMINCILIPSCTYTRELLEQHWRD